MRSIIAALALIVVIHSCHAAYKSIIGDPGMKSNSFRLALEAWNFCNGAVGGSLSSSLPSPRYADCVNDTRFGTHQVSEAVNALRLPQPIPGYPIVKDENSYAIIKEQYLGDLCHSNDWYFWKAMLKGGNFEMSYGYCPKTGAKADNFICFNKTAGCMNQPLVYHEKSVPDGKGGLVGRFYGTYDILPTSDQSRFEVKWRRNADGRWVYSYELKTSKNYPYLMLYHRADNARGLNGGYAWSGRGIMSLPPSGNDFIVQFRLNVTHFEPIAALQFYMPEMAGCWKLDGRPCDGDVKTDVTRYAEMVINPNAGPCGNAKSHGGCPPVHTTITGEKIFRNDTKRYPYDAYHQWCLPSDAPKEIVGPRCDPYSNPQQQELIMCRPHSEWAVHGFPAKVGQGWIGDSRLWKLNVGALTSRLYFSGVEPQMRTFYSFNIGPELFRIGSIGWEISEFDVLVPS
jgi:hypothetical protein